MVAGNVSGIDPGAEFVPRLCRKAGVMSRIEPVHPHGHMARATVAGDGHREGAPLEVA